MRLRFPSAVVLLALLALFTAAPAQDSLGSKTPQVTALPTQAVAVAPGGSVRVELRFRVGAGLHINSSKPRSEFLIPTRLKLNPPANLTPGPIVYPEGKELTFAFSPQEKLNVYAGDFTVRAELRALRSAPPGSYKVQGELRYQACNDRACFPPAKLPVEFEVTVRKPRS
ncbi:MAG: protein-disulfide reductase DsbD domain-containing protein [Terriglobales bacterium]